jgi:hypothetical protein
MHSTLRLTTTLIALAAFAGCSSDEDGALRQLAEQFSSSSAEQLKSQLDSMTVHEHFVLEFVGKTFKQAVFRKACEVDSGIGWGWADGTKYNCAAALVEWQQYVAWAAQNGVDASQELETNRLEILNYYKCKTGEIDAGTCALYQSMQGQIDGAAAQTTQTIVNNFGNQCTIGVDPGCYP